MVKKVNSLRKTLLIIIGIIVISTGILVSTKLSLQSQKITTPRAASGALYTQGNKIYYGDGTRFIAEGANIEFYRDRGFAAT